MSLSSSFTCYHSELFYLLYLPTWAIKHSWSSLCLWHRLQPSKWGWSSPCAMDLISTIRPQEVRLSGPVLCFCCLGDLAASFADCWADVHANGLAAARRSAGGLFAPLTAGHISLANGKRSKLLLPFPGVPPLKWFCIHYLPTGPVSEPAERQIRHNYEFWVEQRGWRLNF